MSQLLLAVYFSLLICAINTEYFVPVEYNSEFALNFINSTSDACQTDMELLVNSLKNHTLWAYRLWDATAKVSVGLTEGSTYQLGHYDECLSIEVPYPAQYCLATVNYIIELNDTIQDPYSLQYKPYESVYNKLYYTKDPSKVRRDRIYWGLCMPASCRPYDIKHALQGYLNEQINSHVTAYEVVINDGDCQMKDNKDDFTMSDYSFCLLILGLILIVIITTTIDVKYSSADSNHKFKTVVGEKSMKLLMCFSFKQNWNALNHPGDSNKALNTLYPAKCFFAFAAILDHSFFTTSMGPVFNMGIIEQKNRELASMLITRGEVLVDAFYLLSGILVTYNFMRQSGKRYQNPVKNIILRYARIAPTLIILIYFYLTILYKTGSGPVWNKIIGTEKQCCEQNWWTTILLINNYINIRKLCVLHSWYLSSEFQMFLLSIPVNALIKRNTKLSWTIVLSILTISMVSPLLVHHFGNTDPIMYVFTDFMNTLRHSDYFRLMYAPFHTRAPPYFLGMLFGYFLYKMRDSTYEMSTMLSCFLFIISVMVLFATSLLGVMYYNPYFSPDVISSSLYIALHKPAFIVALCILIFISGYGYIPILSEFLSWSPFVPLARLTFGTYLVHFVLQLIKVGSTKSPYVFTVYGWLANTILDTVLSFLAALALFILVECPFGRLAKELTQLNLFERKMKKP